MIYYDSDGNECSLDELCRFSPDWAASRVRAGREIERLRADVAERTRERDEARGRELGADEAASEYASALVEATEARDRCSMACADMMCERDALRAEVARLTRERDEAVSYEYVDMQRKNAALRAEVDRLTAERDLARSGIDTIRAEVDELRDVVETYDERFATQHDEHRAEVERLRGVLEPIARWSCERYDSYDVVPKSCLALYPDTKSRWCLRCRARAALSEEDNDE